GHFPGHPIMPAVLIIEAMAQTGGVLLLSMVDDPNGKLVYFMGIDNAKFRRPVRPGDQLRFELTLLKLKNRICKMRGEAFVDGQLVAEAELLPMVVDAGACRRPSGSIPPPSSIPEHASRPECASDPSPGWDPR